MVGANTTPRNCYPGARVDTECPVYQFTDEKLFEDWNWTEKYPGQEELRRYFEHVDKIWGLKKDITFNSRVTAAHWDSLNQSWVVKIAQLQVGGIVEIERYCKALITCTGFASKPYLPHFAAQDTYQGLLVHTSAWPQEGLETKGKRIAVIGTGASGVQVVQTTAHETAALDVYQRTPNYALPMGPIAITNERNQEFKDRYASMVEQIKSTFAGFLYDFNPGECLKATDDERERLYEELYYKGGLHFWLGTYKDVLQNKAANDTAYEFCG